jgi:hypothetical protein
VAATALGPAHSPANCVATPAEAAPHGGLAGGVEADLGRQAQEGAIRPGSRADADALDGADVAAARWEIRAQDQQPRGPLRQGDDEPGAPPSGEGDPGRSLQ